MTALLAPFIAWLTGSRIGKYVALGVLVLIVVGLLIMSYRNSIIDGEQAKQTQKQLQNTIEVLQNVRKMDKAQRSSPRSRRELIDRLRKGSA